MVDVLDPTPIADQKPAPQDQPHMQRIASPQDAADAAHPVNPDLRMAANPEPMAQQPVKALQTSVQKAITAKDGGKQVADLMLKDGMDPDQVKQWTADKKNDMIKAGIQPLVADQYFGAVKPFDLDKTKAVVASNLDVYGYHGWQEGKPVDSMWSALSAGYGMSVMGLDDAVAAKTFKEKNEKPVMQGSESFWQKIAFDAGQQLGDLPATIAGAMAGARGGSKGMAAGAFAAPQLMRDLYLDYLGHHDDPDQRTPGAWVQQALWPAVWDAIKAGGQGVVMTSAAGGAGKFATAVGAGPVGSKLASGAAAVTALTGMQSIAEGHLPSGEDFARAAVELAGFEGAAVVGGKFVLAKRQQAIASKLEEIFQDTGRHPDDVLQEVLRDPAMKAEVMAPRDAMGKPAAPALAENALPEHPTDYKPDIHADTKPTKSFAEQAQELTKGKTDEQLINEVGPAPPGATHVTIVNGKRMWADANNQPLPPVKTNADVATEKLQELESKTAELDEGVRRAQEDLKFAERAQQEAFDKHKATNPDQPVAEDQAVVMASRKVRDAGDALTAAQAKREEHGAEIDGHKQMMTGPDAKRPAGQTAATDLPTHSYPPGSAATENSVLGKQIPVAAHADNISDQTVTIFWNLEHPTGSAADSVLRPMTMGDATSPAGARGVMQIMPKTAEQYGFDPRQLGDPTYNIHASKTILADLSRRYNGNLAEMAVGYNGGPGLADAWIKSGHNLEMLPRETQLYLQHLEKLGAVSGYNFDALPVASAIERLGSDPRADIEGLSEKEVSRVQGAWVNNPAWADEMVSELLPNGMVVPKPEAIASYMQKFGEAAGFKFTVGPAEGHEGEFGGGFYAAYGKINKRTGQFERGTGGVFIPQTSDEQTLRWYGLDRRQIILHEAGHAIDDHLHSGTTKFIPEGKIKDEIVAASRAFRPKLHEEQPDYTMGPSELMADAIAQFISDPVWRKQMPEFAKKYGDKLSKFVDIADKNLPVRNNDGSWKDPEWQTDPEQPGAALARQEQEGASNGGGSGKPPGPPHDNVQEPNPYPNKKIEDQRLKKTPDMAADELLEKIDKGLPQRVKPKWLDRSWFHMFQFELEPAEKIDRDVRKMGLTTYKDLGVADMFRNVYAARSRALAFFTQGKVDPIDPTNLIDRESYQTGLDAVKRNGGTLADFWAYRLAKQTIADWAAGREGTVPLEDAMLALKGDRLSDAKYKEGHDVIRGVKNSTIDYAVKSGYLSDAQAEQWKTEHYDHLVTRRVFDDKYEPAILRTQKFKTTFMKSKTGSDRMIADPATSEFDNMHTLIAMSDRNRAIGNVIGMVEHWNSRLPPEKQIGFRKEMDLPFGGEFGDIMSEPDSNGKSRVLWSAEQQKKDSALQAAPLSPFLAEKVFRAKYGKDGGNRFLYFRNGKAEVWQASSPELADLFRMKNVLPDNPLSSLMRFMGSADRAQIVVDPGFAFRAMTHGQLGQIASAGGTVPYWDVMRGAWAGMNGKFGDLHDEWMRNGGATASALQIHNRYIKGIVDDTFTKTDMLDRVWNVVQHPLEALYKAGHMADTVARVGRYARLTGNGWTPMKAAMETRKAYLDHAEGFASEAMNQWAATTPFMTTGFRDLRQQLYNNFKDDPVMMPAKALAALTAPTLLLWGVHQIESSFIPNQDDRWDAQSETMRDMYWGVPVPMGDGRWTHLKIKKPYSIGHIFGTLPEKFLDWVAGNHPEHVGDFIDAAFKQMAPPVVPEAYTVFGDALGWHSGSGQPWDMKPIVPDSFTTGAHPIAPELQYRPDTTMAAKMIAHSLSIFGRDWHMDSPAIVQQIMDDTIPLATTIARITDTALGAPHLGQPSDWTQTPFVNQFFVRHPEGRGVVEDFLKMGQPYLEAEGSAKREMRLEGPQAAAPYIATAQQAGFSVSKALVSIYRIQAAIRTIEAQPEVSPEVATAHRNEADYRGLTRDEKLKQIDTLTGDIYAVAREGMKHLPH
jgi:hypothetical protein